MQRYLNLKGYKKFVAENQPDIDPQVMEEPYRAAAQNLKRAWI
jgi:hypothetical protein